MAITYTLGDYAPEDSSVKVTYTDDRGWTYERHVNLPKNPDGTVDEEYFAEILEGQLRGVENKIRVGAATFTDPEAVVPEPEPAPLSEPAPEPAPEP